MSWLPIYNAWLIFITLVSLILWNLSGVLLFIILLVVSVFFLIKEVHTTRFHYLSGFWLFILSEVGIFLSLFTTCLWVNDWDYTPISDSLELPFLGCFLLLGSSLTATAYHHSVGAASSKYFLLYTIFLGFCFILLQVFEFYDCMCDLLYSAYHAASFCIVGLHFSHVLIGVVGLILLLGLESKLSSMYYVDLVVWYWHFVDYIWLLVFTIVYLA